MYILTVYWVMLQSAGHMEADCCSMHANFDLAMLQSDGHTEAHHCSVRTNLHWARLQFDRHTNPDDCSMHAACVLTLLHSEEQSSRSLQHVG